MHRQSTPEVLGDTWPSIAGGCDVQNQHRLPAHSCLTMLSGWRDIGFAKSIRRGVDAATVLGGLRERLRPYSRFFPPQVVFRFYERTGTVLALSFFRGLKLASFTVGKPLDKNDSEEDALYPVLRDGDPVGDPVRGKKAAASRAAYLKQKDLIAFLRKQKKTSAVDYNRSLNRLRSEFLRLGEQRRTGIIAPKVRSIDSEPTLK